MQRMVHGTLRGAGWCVEMWRESQVFRWRVVLSVVLLVLVWYLVEGTPPWDKKLQGRIAEREATGDYWRTHDYALYYSWWAALGNAVAAGLLVLTAGWWGKAPIPGAAEGTVVADLRGEGGLIPKGVFLVLVGVVAALAIYERVPRMDDSFWNDEEYGFRKYTVGEYREGKDGEVEFRRVDWEETLFRNRLNNHILQSVGSRLTHAVWESTLRTEDAPHFREWVIRLFPFVCGVGSVVAVALLLGALGHRVAGICAGFYLALAPWQMRFSTEARGYSCAMFFGVMALVFAYLALRDGRWRNWLLFGLCQACVLLSNFGYAPVLLVLNLGLMVLWAMRGSRNYLFGDRSVLAKRWTVANVLAAMVVVQIALPSVPQMRMMLEGGIGLSGSMDFTWWREVWTQLAAGVDWAVSDQSVHHATGAEIEMGRSALFPLWVVWIFPAVSLIGLARTAARHRYLFLAGMTTVAAAVLTWGTNEAKEFFLHTWYVNFALVGMAVYFGMGCGWVAAACARSGWWPAPLGRVCGMAVVATFLGIYAVGTATCRAALRDQDRQPVKWAVEFIRGETPAPVADAVAPVVVTVSTTTTPTESYVANNIQVESLAALEPVVAEAKAGGRDIYVLVMGRNWALPGSPTREVIEYCGNGEIFEEVAFFKGMAEEYSVWVYKLRR